MIHISYACIQNMSMLSHTCTHAHTHTNCIKDLGNIQHGSVKPNRALNNQSSGKCCVVKGKRFTMGWCDTAQHKVASL